MDEPASWQLVEWVAERIRGITVASGYRTDLGAGGVATDDEINDLDDGEPDSVVVMTDLDIGTASSQHLHSTATLVIESAMPRSVLPANPRKLSHRVSADLRAALTVKEKQLPRFITSLSVAAAQLVDVVDESGTASVVVQVTARAGLVDIAPPAQPTTP